MRVLLLALLILIVLFLLWLWWWRSRDTCPEPRGEGGTADGIPARHDLRRYVLDGLVVGERGTSVSSGSLVRLPPSDIDKELRCTSRGEREPGGVGTDIAEIVDVYRITDGSDPIEVANRHDGLAPVSIMASAVHWSFEPGEDARPFFDDDGQRAKRPLADAPGEEVHVDRVIAVVDTGFVETNLPWIDDHVRWERGQDLDTDGRGHGTFIASLIRQVAPNADVSIARAATVDHSRVVIPTSDLDEPELIPPDVGVTSELHVAAAIIRLLARNHRYPVAALNLSLGSWEEEDGQPLLIRRTLERWSREIGSPIVAAGGNEDNVNTEHGEHDEDGKPASLVFYPAAFSSSGAVEAVDALDLERKRVYWDPATRARHTFAGHIWAKREMLGVDLLGVCGPDATTCVRGGAQDDSGNTARLATWSGTSFAAPIVAALIANGVAPIPDYTQVPGLIYVVNGQPAGGV